MGDSQSRIGEKGCRERVRKPEELGEWDGLNENAPPPPFVDYEEAWPY